MFESLFAYTTPAMENFVAVVSDRLHGQRRPFLGPTTRLPLRRQQG